MKSGANVATVSKRVKEQKIVAKQRIFCWHLETLKPLKKRAGSGSIIQWYGPAEPDPHQHLTDSEH